MNKLQVIFRVPALPNIDYILRSHNVSEGEQAALYLALEGLSTADIALHLGCSPDAVRKRLGQVYQKFRIEGKGPGKLTDLKYKLAQYQEQHTETVVISSEMADHRETDLASQVSDLPNLPTLWGRTTELTTLKQWILQDKCRLVAILGMVGMGKTALTTHLTQQLEDQFDYVIWHSLQRETLSITKTLDHWLTTLFNLSERKQDFPNSVEDKLTLLIQEMRTSRCLLIIDDFESIFNRHTLAGIYHKDYQDYQELIRRIAEFHHRSCLILVGAEKPIDLTRFEGETLPVRSLQLSGFKTQDAQKMIQSVMGLSGSESEISHLVQRYSGNPLALKTVSTTIRELFNGNLEQFLKQNFFLDDLLTQELNQQLCRLSDLERQILYRWALKEESMTLSQLHSISLDGNVSNTLRALESLKRRSLLEVETVKETWEVQWKLLPMVQQCIIHQVMERLSQRIAEYGIDTEHGIDQLELIQPLEVLQRIGIVTVATPEEDETPTEQLTSCKLAKHLNKRGQQKYFKGDFVSAKLDLMWALKFDPNLASAHYNLGSTYEELEDKLNAKKHYKIAAKSQGQVGYCAVNNIARLEILSGQVEQAIRLILSVIDQAERQDLQVSIHKNLGWAYFLKTSLNEAEEELRKSTGIDKNHASSNYLLAKVLEAKGQKKEALKYWSKALENDKWLQKQEDVPWRLPELEEWRATAFQRLNFPEIR